MEQPDPATVGGLVAADRERRLMPGGTLPACIAEVQRALDKTRRQLRHATEAAHDAFLVGIEPAEFGRLTNCHGGIEYRAILLEDMWRQQQHLAELEVALEQVVAEEAAALRSVVGRLARGIALAC